MNKYSKLALVLLLGRLSICAADEPAVPLQKPAPGPQSTPVAAMPIAVIPFINLSDDSQADQKVAGLFVTQLLSTGAYVVTEPTEVETALSALRARGQIDSDQVKQVSDKIGVRLLLLGSITEFGASRASNGTLTVAMNARLLDTSTSSIVWASSVIKTGRNDDSLFGAGPPTVSKLMNQAVQQLVRQMTGNRKEIAKLVASNGGKPVAKISGPVTGPGSQRNSILPRDRQGAQQTAAVDDSAQLTFTGLQSVLPSVVDGADRSEITESDRCHGGWVSTYKGKGYDVEVTVADCQKSDQAKALAKSQCREPLDAEINGLPAYSFVSTFGYLHLNVAVGRYVVLLSGPSEKEPKLRGVGVAVIKSLKGS